MPRTNVSKECNPMACCVAVTAFILFMGCASGILAQSPPETFRLPVVEVLATSVQSETAVQDQARSISLLTGQELESAGITALEALPRLVPGYSQSHAGLRSFSDNHFIRGIGNADFLGDPGVVVYVDDAPFGDALTFTHDLLAIESIEVFRGPQGPRFGKNAAAGVINITTRQPMDQFTAGGSASYATFNSHQNQVQVSVPVVKGKLLFSAAGQQQSSDGYIKNTYLNRRADERESVNARAGLRWFPNEIWELDFSGNLDRYDDGFGLTSLVGSPRQTASEFEPELKQRVNGQSIRIRGGWPQFTVTSITARRQFDLDPLLLDADFSPLTGNTGIVRNAQTQWSEEMRLAPTTPSDDWNWHAGFFFSTVQSHTVQENSFFIPPGGPAGRDVIAFKQDSQDYALFGEFTRRFGLDCDATLGLRLDYAVRGMERTRQPPFGPPPADLAEASGFINCTPKFTLAYHFTDEVQVYGSTGLGFKPGGYSGYVDPPVSPLFETEHNWANEIGVKSTWLEGRLTANAALFYYDITDYQVEQFVPVGFDFIIVNAPKATSMGGEIELSFHPAKGLELGGFLGYTDTRLESYTDPFTGATVRNVHAPNVALFNGGVWVQGQLECGLVARIDYGSVGDTYYDAANREAFQRSAYSLLSARIGFERDHYGVFVVGENLTDEEYFTKKIAPLNAGAPGRPQMFGIVVSLKY